MRPAVRPIAKIRKGYGCDSVYGYVGSLDDPMLWPFMAHLNSKIVDFQDGKGKELIF